MTINMPGKHNVLNALAATRLALELEFRSKLLPKRLQVLRALNAVLPIEAHSTRQKFLTIMDIIHKKYNVTLAVARKRAKGRLIVVFQPHRYTRTDKLWNNFIAMFLKNPIDQLIITDIYPASETPIPGITAENLVKAIKMQNPTYNVAYQQANKLIQAVDQTARPNDLILCIGAGKHVGTLAKELPQKKDRT